MVDEELESGVDAETRDLLDEYTSLKLLLAGLDDERLCIAELDGASWRRNDEHTGWLRRSARARCAEIESRVSTLSRIRGL